MRVRAETPVCQDLDHGSGSLELYYNVNTNINQHITYTVKLYNAFKQQ
jgi:hypothetical protein